MNDKAIKTQVCKFASYQGQKEGKKELDTSDEAIGMSELVFGKVGVAHTEQPLGFGP